MIHPPEPPVWEYISWGIGHSFSNLEPRYQCSSQSLLAYWTSARWSYTP